MTEIQAKLVIESLRYNLEKVIFRDGCEHDHIELSGDSLSSIICVAEKIAMEMNQEQKVREDVFSLQQPLESVFNILNGNNEKKIYQPMLMDRFGNRNDPIDRTEIIYEREFCESVKDKLEQCFREISSRDARKDVNKLLKVMEETLSFIPYAIPANEDAPIDISLYDHAKMTAAVGSCIYSYLHAEKTSDYERELLENREAFYEKKVFYLYCMDISGIQDFIYTIASSGALKGLRTRSFYLEIMMEHLLDTLLESLSLSRANLIYSGGGHAYILLPNLEEKEDGKGIEQITNDFIQKTNEWFLETFETSLYMAGGGVAASAKDFWNKPAGAYQRIFQAISEQITRKKLQRYSADEIKRLNKMGQPNGDRECKICHRHDKIREGKEKCKICEAIEGMSEKILNKSFYSVTREIEEEGKPLLPLPSFSENLFLDAASLEKRRQSTEYVRSYSKNQLQSRLNVTDKMTNLWVGDYANGDTFEELAKSSEGIERLAILRADVDNLGRTFLSGFQRGNDAKYVTLERVATLSRKLSLFFKYHINDILEHGTHNLLEKETEKGSIKRKALVVYSGGDDMFVVGAWHDVIGFAMDLYDALKEYAQGTLTISAGIGLYPSKYPISVMAHETGDLEDAAKTESFEREENGKEAQKNAVALFHKDYVFGWEEFIQKVVEEKLRELQDYFALLDERGNSFLYNLLDLVRRRKGDEPINLARYAYLLGKMEPERKASDNNKKFADKQKRHQDFSKKMYRWMKRNNRDTKQLEMAIYLYIYLNRKEEKRDE